MGGADKPVDFIVDTAATRSILFENAVSNMSLTPSGEPDVKLVGLAGIRTAPTYRVGDIKADSLVLEDYIAPVLDDWTEWARTPQGVLGLDFFGDVTLVFNPSRSELIVYGPDATVSDTLLLDWRRVPLMRSNFGITSRPFFIVKVLMRGKEIPFLLDTGSTDTICNLQAVSHLTTIPSIDFDALRAGEIRDVHGGVVKTFRLIQQSLQLETVTLSAKPILVADTPFFKQIGFEDKPFGILGLDHLLQQPIAIDLSRNVLFIK